jgi:hypothetical protein
MWLIVGTNIGPDGARVMIGNSDYLATEWISHSELRSTIPHGRRSCTTHTGN